MKEIECFFQNSVEEKVFPGCLAAVIDQNRVDYYCAGDRDILPDKVTNDLSTIYDLASLSKVVSTTMIILRLIQEGRLDEMMPAQRIIPELSHAMITVRDLLTHTSGLPADIVWHPSLTKASILQYIYQVPLVFPTGTQGLYSDLGYILLGEMIERITGMRLDQAAAYYVFKPLHMTETCYCPSMAKKARCAATEISPDGKRMLKGEVHDHKAIMMDGIAGHAGVFSTIQDMVQYADMLLNNGYAGQDCFLEAKFVKLLHAHLTPAGEIARGVGFLTKDDRSPFSNLNTSAAMMHTGFTGTSILVDAGLKMAIIVLSNRVHPTRENTKIIAWRKEMHDFIIKCYLSHRVLT